MDPKDIASIAHEAGKAGGQEAVHETFRLLGVDTNNQDSLNRLRSDLVSARQVREFRESTTRRFWLVVVGASAIAALTAFWDGIKHKLGMG